MIFFDQWLNKYTFIDSLWQFTNFDFEQFMEFDNFSELQNVISDSIIPTPSPKSHYDALRTKIDI